ncbi:hypothetical protein B0H67DRAFT_336731 [Lasiosphaeris hirsuta]|uniref:Uncharacterized protein n=1 Tax=Lasiosphaeris hirsuta TaxID=260670 RepID=A0AA40A349_9PEZI|nr:hypothetical protein B0H67DRAFT_336731 [Lasiosphaeris hirsuta]
MIIVGGRWSRLISRSFFFSVSFLLCSFGDAAVFYLHFLFWRQLRMGDECFVTTLPSSYSLLFRPVHRFEFMASGLRHSSMKSLPLRQPIPKVGGRRVGRRWRYPSATALLRIIADHRGAIPRTGRRQHVRF